MHQNGQIFDTKKSWYGRWYQNVIVPAVEVPAYAKLIENLPDGKVLIRKQITKKLADKADGYRTKKSVEPLLERELTPINENRINPHASMTVQAFADEMYWPWAKQMTKPSTYCGYYKLWKKHFVPHVGGIAL